MKIKILKILNIKIHFLIKKKKKDNTLHVFVQLSKQEYIIHLIYIYKI